MLYYFPTSTILFVLIIDVLVLLFLIVSYRRKKRTRIVLYSLIFLLLLITIPFKVLSLFNPFPSIRGTLRITNELTAFSPVYYFNKNGDIEWIFLAFKDYPSEQGFDIEGRHEGTLAIDFEGRYSSYDFRYQNGFAKIVLTNSNLNFEKDEFINDLIRKNLFNIVAHYLSHFFTLCTLFLILSRILNGPKIKFKD